MADMQDKIDNIMEQIKGLSDSGRWELLEDLERELRGSAVLVHADLEAVVNHTGQYGLVDLPKTQQSAMMCEITDSLNEFIGGLFISTAARAMRGYVGRGGTVS